MLGWASPGNELTFTVVLRGTGQRLGLDRDEDGVYDRDELDAGTNLADAGIIQLTEPPRSTKVLVNSNAVLQVEAESTRWNFRYQWFKDGATMAEATNAVLTLTNVPLSATGDYQVLVGNSLHSITSPPARLTVMPFLASVTPAHRAVRVNSNTTFAVSIVGEEPFTYQWLHDGVDLPDATGRTLTLTNVRLPADGRYSARVANRYGSSVTEPGSLTVLVSPVFLVPPSSQEVVAGQNAIFSVAISGSPPPFGYQLRKNATVLTNYLTDERTAFLTFFNVQPSNAGLYRIVVTNAANFPPGTGSELVSITVLADSDHDGLPDVWEAAHGLSPNDPTDASADADLDGATNWQEYVAGTDPQDSRSHLGIEALKTPGTAPSEVVLRFIALSNRTYTVEFRDGMETGAWTRFRDIIASPTHRLVEVTNQASVGILQRLYRVTAPRAP